MRTMRHDAPPRLYDTQERHCVTLTAISDLICDGEEIRVTRALPGNSKLTR